MVAFYIISVQYQKQEDGFNLQTLFRFTSFYMYSYVCVGGEGVGGNICDCKTKRTVMLANAHRKDKTSPGILQLFTDSEYNLVKLE